MDRAGRRLMLGQVGVEAGQGTGAGAVAVPEHPGQVRPGRCAGGHGVDLAVLEKLQAVLDGPQEPVGRTEPFGVGVSHVPTGGKSRQRGESGGGAKSLVLPPVHQLEQLDGELDVAYTAPPQLYLPLREPMPGHRLFGPGFHGP